MNLGAAVPFAFDWGYGVVAEYIELTKVVSWREVSRHDSIHEEAGRQDEAHEDC